MNVPPSLATMEGRVEIWMAITPASAPRRMLESSASNVSSLASYQLFLGLLLLLPILNAVHSSASQGAPLCWGWRVAQSWSLKFQRPLFTMPFLVFSVGAPIWRGSITRASLMHGHQPAMTRTPGLRSEKSGHYKVLRLIDISR